MDEKIKGIIDNLKEKLPSILEERPVILAYLYGSTAVGNPTPLSDVDIALVTKEKISPLERFDLEMSLECELIDKLGISNPDVRIVNDTPIIFRGRVVTEGILLYSRDEDKRVDFEVATRMRYFDFKPVYDRMMDEFMKRLKEEGLFFGKRRETER